MSCILSSKSLCSVAHKGAAYIRTALTIVSKSLIDKFIDFAFDFINIGCVALIANHLSLFEGLPPLRNTIIFDLDSFSVIKFSSRYSFSILIFFWRFILDSPIIAMSSAYSNKWISPNSGKFTLGSCNLPDFRHPPSQYHRTLDWAHAVSLFISVAMFKISIFSSPSIDSLSPECTDAVKVVCFLVGGPGFCSMPEINNRARMIHSSLFWLPDIFPDATNPTPKNCRSSLEGVWRFAYQNRFLFTGECKHPDANITSCQKPGTQFFIENQQFIMNYKKCEGITATEDAGVFYSWGLRPKAIFQKKITASSRGHVYTNITDGVFHLCVVEVQYKCLGDWYIGKNHFWAVMNARESRREEAYRCFLANRDDDFFLAVSITAECNTLKNPQEGPERLHLEPVKTEVVPPKCQLPDNFTGEWINTANFDAEVIINSTHMVERWKPDQGREKIQIYVCQERRDTRFVMARFGIDGCQKDYVCFDFVNRHHNIIRYRQGKAMITDNFPTVCSWAMFPNKEEWRSNLLLAITLVCVCVSAKNPVYIKCPIAGKFRFEQKGDILFETRIRGGVTKIPRPNVYCQENISDFSVCDSDQKTITIDADYCISVDYFGKPVDIYSEWLFNVVVIRCDCCIGEPDYEMYCIGFWKENLKSYLITYDQEDAYSKYRCWVYQRSDLNRVLLSQAVGAFCHIKQDVISGTSHEGAQVALSMVEYEREHDNCPMYFDDGTDPYRMHMDQVAKLWNHARRTSSPTLLPMTRRMLIASTAAGFVALTRNQRRLATEIGLGLPNPPVERMESSGRRPDGQSKYPPTNQRGQDVLARGGRVGDTAVPNDNILECIVTNTNIYIRNIQQNYSRERDANLTNLHEIKALLGIIYFLGVMKANKLNTDDTWARDSTGFELCRIAMSENRFRFLLRVIRFDDKATRNERPHQDKLAAVRLILDTFVKNCQKHYSPSEYITVDEKLDAFRGKCNFRQYIPSKHNKYGIKLFALVDSKMFYTCNLEIYSGKNPEGPCNVSNSPSDVVERLCEPIKGTGRNVTMDNWFTSYSLALKLLQQFRLTIVGTLKRNKKEIPSEFVISRGRNVHTSVFGFQSEMTLLSYKPKENKVILESSIFASWCRVESIISTLHHDANIDDSTGELKKPEMIMFYNMTKGGVDMMDEMTATYNCARNSRRWPMVIFYSLLNIGAINSQIIHFANGNASKVKSRRHFLKTLSLDLIEEMVKVRTMTTAPCTLTMVPTPTACTWIRLPSCGTTPGPPWGPVIGWL
ncbi:hypothetical protein LAZ67_6001730 [Cordylochernes scorpioides]|uniref:PiggyBac transposable element-derived protein domain-containing protein n=1 Tax=Cordylochernes scorpioides TaxID=51811 RepID=A0ABY6KL72_9ARAC|nr:hypothetical protein LAZ67_6001730 [Cordylochernes scorpioides]